MDRALLGLSVGGGAIFLVAIFAFVAAWVTHIVVVITAITSDAAVSVSYGILLVLGTFVPPVGSIHGFGVWFGWW